MPAGKKIQQAFALLFVGAIVGVSIYAAFRAGYWDPRHRPLIVVPAPQGGSVEIDGRVACSGLPAYVDESTLRPCASVVQAGEHTVVVKDANGAELHRDGVTISKGDSTFVVSHELPRSQCLRTAVYRYTEVVIPGLGSGPEKHGVAPGFVDIGDVDDVFKSPPASVESKEKSASRTALRLESCEATE